MSDVTRILGELELGDAAAADRLLPLVYAELKRLAAARLAQEKPGQTLQPTALVHEAYLRLVDVDRPQEWDGRGHFFAAAAEAMRRILIENARRKMAARRGGELKRLSLDEADVIAESTDQQLLALDEALSQLLATHPTIGQLVTLRYFGGLTIEQALGEIDRLDERADVFGLGAVLCEILTGKPPYIGADGTQVFRQASRGKLDDCFDGLDASGTDQELVALAKRAIAPEPERRWRHAGALADAMSNYLNGVQERLKQAEIAKSQAQARRKLHFVISGMMLFIAIATALLANRFWRQGKIQAALTQEANQATEQANQATQDAKHARDDAEEKSQRLAEQLQISTINLLAAQSHNLQESQPVLSTLLAMEAVEVSKQDGQAFSIALESLMNATSGLGGRAYYAHHTPIQVLAVSNGRMVASGDSEGRVCLWDVYADNPKETVQILDGHTAAITSIKFAPDNRWLVTGSEDGDVRRWDLHASRVADAGQVLKGHTQHIRAADISRDGRWLITASHDKTVRLWDLEQVDPSTTARELAHQGRLESANFVLDDRWIITNDWGASPNHWRFWDLQKVITSDPKAASPSFKLAGGNGIRLFNVHGFTSDGHFMLTDSGIWQLHEDRVPTRLATFDATREARRGWRMRFLKNDQLLLIGRKGSTQALWEWRGDDLGGVVREFSSGWATFSPDAKWMLDPRGVSADVLVDWEDKSKPAVWIGDPRKTPLHVFTPDSRRLIAADGGGGIRVWDLNDDLFTSPMINHGVGSNANYVGVNPHFVLDTSPDGRSIAVADGGAVRLARLESGQFSDFLRLEGPESRIWARAVQPRRKLVCGRKWGKRTPLGPKCRGPKFSRDHADRLREGR